MTGNATPPGPYRRPAAAPEPAVAAERPTGRRAAADPDAYRSPDRADQPEPDIPPEDAPSPALPPETLTGGGSRGWLWRLLVAGLGLGATATLAWLIERAIAAAQAGSPIAMLTTAALGLMALGTAGLILREVGGLARLRGRSRLRAAVERADAGRDGQATAAALRQLEAMHGARPELAWALARYREAAADAPDAADRLALYEQLVQAPLDRAAVAAIRTIARRAAVLTAISPNAVLDAVVVLWLNLAVIRRVAEIQGLRPGLLASGPLVRRTVLAMVAAGGIETLGDLAPHALAGSVVRGVAKRVGEGAINGLLTIRLGLAALEACRPMPFAASPRPSTATLARQALGIGNDSRRDPNSP